MESCGRQWWRRKNLSQCYIKWLVRPDFISMGRKFAICTRRKSYKNLCGNEINSLKWRGFFLPLPQWPQLATLKQEFKHGSAIYFLLFPWKLSQESSFLSRPPTLKAVYKLTILMVTKTTFTTFTLLWLLCGEKTFLKFLLRGMHLQTQKSHTEKR